MIGWLTKLAPVPDHPMRDLKAAQRIVDELPKGDAYKCLLELSAWIESVVQASGYRLQTRAAIIKLLMKAVMRSSASCNRNIWRRTARQNSASRRCGGRWSIIGGPWPTVTCIVWMRMRWARAVRTA